MLALITGSLLALLPQDVWTHEQMRADLEQLTGSVRESWSYLELRTRDGLDTDRSLAESLASLEHVTTRTDFERVLRTLVARLRDGHAHLTIDTGGPREQYLLLEVAPCVEGLVVTWADPGFVGGNDARTPARGDLLTAVDGTAVDELVRELLQTTFGSTVGQRRIHAVDALLRTQNDAVEVELEDAEGRRHRTLLRPRKWPRMGDARRDNWALSWPEDDVAVLRTSSFAVADWAAWLEASPEEREPFVRDTYRRIEAIFTELREREATGLILDLRGNGGGTDLLAIHLAKHLVTGSFRFFLLSSKRDGTWTHPGGIAYRADPGMTTFEGRVVALIDERCFSTTDNLLRCLSVLHPRFTTVGRPSGGGTGAPRVIATLAHSGATVRLCTMRVFGPEGEPIEGRGTTPDIPVTWTRSDVVGGRDPDLEAALESLARSR